MTAVIAALFSCPLSIDGSVRAQAPEFHTLLVRCAPDSGSVYLTWNDIPGARYSVQWRERGSSRWSEDAVSATHKVVTDLTNDQVYEFRVIAIRNSRGDIPSNVIRMAPRVRSECAPGNVGFFCSVEPLRAFLAQLSADAYLQCGDAIISEISIDIPNCWYRSSRGTAVLNRYFGAEYRPPISHPSIEVIREIARHALWPTGDPFTSPTRFSLQMLPMPHAVSGKVDASLFGEVNSLLIDYGFELKSRISWFQPLAPVKGRYAIYYEGHDFEAVVDGANVIEWLLRRGWQVIVIDMPLTGANATDRTSPFTEHEDLGFEFARSGGPMDAFLLPPKAVVDSIFREANQPEILMLGRSGGGAMSAVYSMLDQRVTANVNIAGGAPETMVYDSPKATQGDFEQFYAPLIDVLPRDLQLLSGGERGSFFYYSKNDACCFRFDPTDPWIQYLLGASAGWGKTVQVSLDVVPQHGLSEKGFSDLDSFLRSVRMWSPVVRLLPPSSAP